MATVGIHWFRETPEQLRVLENVTGTSKYQFWVNSPFNPTCVGGNRQRKTGLISCRLVWVCFPVQVSYSSTTLLKFGA